jgi:thiol:disulfide interchange protein DsbD
MMKTRTIAVLLLLLGSLAAGLYVRAEDSTVVNFSYNKQRINEKQVLLLLQVKVKPGYKLFALQKKEEDVLFSTITFDSAATKHLSGTVIEKGTKKTELDAATQANVEYFADSVVWQQKINAAATDSFLVKGNINYLFAKADEYIPGEESFKIYI